MQAESAISIGETGHPVVDSLTRGKLHRDSRHPLEKLPQPAGVGDPSSVSWNAWLEYFHETDTLEERREELGMELQEAIAREQFSEAAQLKLQLEDVIRRDIVRAVAEVRGRGAALIARKCAR